MISKRYLYERVEGIDDRIADLRYDLNLAYKKISELESAINKNKPKKVVAVKRKPGRPRKEVKRVDFAKKK